MPGAAHLHALESALATLERQKGTMSAQLEAARNALREAVETMRRIPPGAASEAQDHAASLRADARAMADRQRGIAEEMGALGAQQADLGRKQAELGHQQRVAADAARQRIMRLLQEAAAAGQAQPVR